MAERKTVYKWIWAWEFDKEERWLNAMAMEGWALADVGLCKFTFERCEPGEYIVATEMRAPDSEYISFMQEMGAEYIGRMIKWIYFRRKASEGPFELFSDLDSRIAHLGRIARTIALGMGLNLYMGIFNSLGSAPRMGWINLLAASLLAYGLGRVREKKSALEAERKLRE